MKKCVGEKTEMATTVLSLRSSGLSQDGKSHRGMKTQKVWVICWHGKEGKELKAIIVANLEMFDFHLTM